MRIEPRHKGKTESPFNGPLRNHHRVKGKPLKTWDEWVDGKPRPDRQRSKKWPVLFAIVGLLALASIAVGLFIELR